MSSRLDHILPKTRSDVQTRKAAANLLALEQRAQAHQPRGFAHALRHASTLRLAVIAELKQASPSKGLIRSEFDPVSLALGLQSGGAAALSILTDEPFFQGSLHNLELASASVTIPCLRKDFMVDPFQMLEARAYGADAVLLIVAAHTDADLKLLRASAHNYELDVLCEVHNREELERALPLNCEAIGVNRRDLRDFSMRPEGLLELVDAIPASVVRVAESGISSADDMLSLRAAGYDAFLIGEALMRHPDPGARLAELLSPSPQRAQSPMSTL